MLKGGLQTQVVLNFQSHPLKKNAETEPALRAEISDDDDLGERSKNRRSLFF
jgi:hypothetical protein